MPLPLILFHTDVVKILSGKVLTRMLIAGKYKSLILCHSSLAATVIKHVHVEEKMIVMFYTDTETEAVSTVCQCVFTHTQTVL